MENELIALHPNSFETIQHFFTKSKSLAPQCKQCGIERKDEQLVVSILNNFGSKYSIFISTFHFGRASIPNWKIHSLDAFAKSLIQEQDKLVQMGVIQTSKNQALLVAESNNGQARGKHKRKETKNSDSNPKENKKSSDGALGSKKKKKFEKTRCPYYMRGFHPESQCMNNTID